MKQLDYQENAVQKLVEKTNELLNISAPPAHAVRAGNRTIVFKAPTGSGKTVMMAKYLEHLVHYRSDDKTFSFIWAAPRSLHTQSKEKLQKLYDDSKALKCSFFEDLTDRKIGENEILFLNWEKINQADNIYIRENEREFNLENVIMRSKDEGRNLLLIIDESHHTAGAENTRSLLNLINAKVTVEVSATPKISGDETVTVYREHVIAEQMIKKQIAINPDAENVIKGTTIEGFKIETSDKDSTSELLIKMALAKREQLKKFYELENSEVNPLLLIQLPDKRADVDLKDDIVSILEENHNIKVSNGKLAIYLSEDKENLDTITKNNSPVEVMIFKQAIALGWDCPRASILALFRDWRSIVFSIQTVGRIMRMAELKHYETEDLNVGYIYTNLGDISIHQDIADGYATIYHSKRKEIYQNIGLTSCHSKRQRERTRLSPLFMIHFKQAADEMDLKNTITKDVSEITQTLISDGIVENIDQEFDHLEPTAPDLFETHYSSVVQKKLNEVEVQKIFDNFIIEALHPLYPESRSIGRLKESIYRFFIGEFPMEFQFGGLNSQLVVLSEKNNQKFLDVINKAKQTYLEEVEKTEKELVTDENWEVPTSLNFTGEFVKKENTLSILDPFYQSKTASQPEIKFAKFLNQKTDEIEWWYKNGERDGRFFAVPYEMNGESTPFYVDWIVKYKDGRIGLFDTKAGITAREAKERAEGLAKYIKSENDKGKKLFGGIVIEKDGSFWYNDQEIYHYDWERINELGWKILS